MYIKAVSPYIVAVCLSKEEIEKRGFFAVEGGRSADSAAARKIVRELLRGGGYPPWDFCEIDFFENSGSVLILARAASGGVSVFRAADIESLLGGVISCPEDIPSSLYAMDGELYLCLRCRAELLPPRAAEFGDSCEMPENYLCHLDEHGECIISENAVQALREFFISGRY